MPMNRPVRAAAALALLAVAACASGRPASPAPCADPTPELSARIVEMLRAYGRKDDPALLAILQPGEVMMYGADSAEVALNRADVMRRVRDDQMLWDSLVAGPVRNLRVEHAGPLAVAMFDVPTDVYRGPGRAHYLVRFATTWRRAADGQWRMVQSMNSVPTKGQSAAEIIRAQSRPR